MLEKGKTLTQTLNLSVDSFKSHASLEDYSRLAMEHTPYVEFTVRHDHLEGDCKKFLALAIKQWECTDTIELTQFKDGITNKLMKCTNVNTSEVILIRAYGKKSELIIDRVSELANFVTLSSAGLSPPIHARFTNGFAYGFIHGRALKSFEMGDPHISGLIAGKLALWHHVSRPIRQEQEPVLFCTLKRWLKGVPREYKDANIQRKFAQNIDKTYLGDQIQHLKSMVVRLNSPVVFCHNDLLSGNIVYNDEKDEIHFIDFEYGGNNYRGFDIGNHFCEYAGFECDYSRYPSKDRQIRWLRKYLTSYHGSEPKPCELEDVYLEVNVFALCAHYFWGLWALVQAYVSDIDFDYLGYAILRFNQYEATKGKCFDLFDEHFKDIPGELGKTQEIEAF